MRYGMQGSERTLTMNVSGGASTDVTIFGLNAATTYLIEVAAVNSVGPGKYSSPIRAFTLCKYFKYI